MRFARPVLAFGFISALVSVATTIAIVSMFDPPLSWGEDWNQIAFLLKVNWVFSVVGGLVAGLPLLAFMRSLGRNRQPLAMALAGLAGGAAFVFITLMFLGTRTLDPLIAVGSFGGLVAALAWWLIVERGVVADAN